MMCNISEMRDQLDYLENLGFDGIVAERQILMAKAQRLDVVVDKINAGIRNTAVFGDEGHFDACCIVEMLLTLLNAAKGEGEVRDDKR